MWDQNEIQSYHHFTNTLHIGQINPDQDIGQFLMTVAQNTNYKRYLEIGTWNGQGSTRCFHQGFLRRIANANVNGNTNIDFVLYSLECNPDKCADAQKLYQEYPFMKILNAKAVQEIPSEIVLASMFKNFVPAWHTVDIENMNICPYLFDTDTTKEFDVILFDGGEFTTYFEYLELKDHCKMIICDDCNTDKCAKIREELLASPIWKLLHEDLQSRNGWCVFERISISS